MIAHLGMYLRPETAEAHNRFWSLIRQELGAGPAKLSRDSDFWRVWRKPALLLAQTCGMPYRTRLHGHVNLIGTPDYGLPGCAPGHYRSVFVVHKDAAGDSLTGFSGKTFAYNEALSQSGWAAPVTHANALGLRFGTLLQSGGHRQSAQCVAEGKADIAALDAVTWQLLKRFDRFSDQLRVIDQTTPTPGLPYITSVSRDPKPIYTAIETAIGQLGPDDQELLMLRGMTSIAPQDYLAIPTPVGPRDYETRDPT